MTVRTASGLLVLALALLGPKPAGSELDEALDTVKKGTSSAAESQKRIDRIAEETDAVFAEFRGLEVQLTTLEAYNDQISRLVEAQAQEIASLEDQINRVADIEQQLVPMLLEMVDSLEAFIGLDVPFLLEERRERVSELRAMMNRADVTVSEKYRRVLEAYQVENEYGRTIEAYRGNLVTGGAERTVSFLRVGRVALLYETLDSGEVGVWSATSGAFEPLPEEYRTEIRHGLRMAKQQIAPDLIRVPVPAPQRGSTRQAGEEGTP